MSLGTSLRAHLQTMDVRSQTLVVIELFSHADRRPRAAPPALPHGFLESRVESVVRPVVGCLVGSPIGSLHAASWLKMGFEQIAPLFGRDANQPYHMRKRERERERDDKHKKIMREERKQKIKENNRQIRDLSKSSEKKEEMRLD